MIRQTMLAAGCAAVAVSGSGPTLFGLVAADASPVAKAVRAEYGDEVWVQTSRVEKTTD
jgi:shikimate kinase